MVIIIDYSFRMIRIKNFQYAFIASTSSFIQIITIIKSCQKIKLKKKKKIILIYYSIDFEIY